MDNVWSVAETKRFHAAWKAAVQVWMDANVEPFVDSKPRGYRAPTGPKPPRRKRGQRGLHGRW